MYDDESPLHDDFGHEITAALVPSKTAFLRRDTETAWIHAYPAAGVVTVTYPPVTGTVDPSERFGVVRELCAWPGREWTEHIWQVEVDRHVRSLGWALVPCNVTTIDPWDVPRVTDNDRGLPF